MDCFRDIGEVRGHHMRQYENACMVLSDSPLVGPYQPRIMEKTIMIAVICEQYPAAFRGMV